MAESPQNVGKFLDQLATKLRILLEQEYEILLNYKKEEVFGKNLQFIEYLVFRKKQIV